jgi:hypothetical protein
MSRRGIPEFSDLSKIEKAPSLMTINTFGFRLYGNSDYDEATDSYMATQYLVAMFIPIFPVARYRVTSDDGHSYEFFGKGKLRRFEKIHMTIVFAILLYAAYKVNRH